MSSRTIDYSRPSHQLVLDLINIANEDTDPNWVDLTMQGVVVYNARPEVASPDWRDTICRVEAVPGAGFEGSREVRYRRIDATKAFKGREIYIKPDNQVLSGELLPAINERYNLSLLASDIINEPIDVYITPLPYTIRFRGGNPAWVGQIDVIVQDRDTSLEWLVKETVVDEFHYPNRQGGIMQAYLHAYRMDFTHVETFINHYEAGDAVDSMLKAYIHQIDKDTPWVYTNTSKPLPFNMYGGQVLYNGEPTPIYTNRMEFEKIMVIKLSDLKCSGISGGLVIHYNTNEIPHEHSEGVAL